MKPAKEYYIDPVLTLEETMATSGTFIDKYTTVITKDADVYYKTDEGDYKLLFIFRKKVFSDAMMDNFLKVFKEPAMENLCSRGKASGKMDINTFPETVVDFVTPDKCSSQVIYDDGTISDYKVTNRVSSMIAGYFDKPKLRHKTEVINSGAPPCRTTAFTEEFPKEWKSMLPMLRQANQLYKHFLPTNHKEQLSIAKLTPEYQIAKTAFSTVTVNYNWRTACHKDAGDYHNGYSVITVATEGKYKGGILGYPRFDIGVDVRHGDFLLKDPHQFHANTEICPITKEYTRLSMVMYYREKIQQCANWDPKRSPPKSPRAVNSPKKSPKPSPKKSPKLPTPSPKKCNNSLTLMKVEKIKYTLPDRTVAELYIRPNTTDIKVVDEVLKKHVYVKPKLDFYQLEDELWFDLGGNIGTFAISCLLAGANVIIYEPEPDNLKLLEQNIQHTTQMYNIKNGYKIMKCAIGIIKKGDPKTVDLYICKGDYNKYRHTLYKKRGRETIKIDLCDFREQMEKHKPNGVKIDIEGSEIDILENVTAKDWARWQTQKLVFEYSFDIDPSIPRFLAIVKQLKKYFKHVYYDKVKENELEYKYFPPMCICYCLL